MRNIRYHNNSERLKWGFFSFDAAIAVIIVISIVYFASYIAAGIENSIRNLQTKDRIMDVLLLSNEIVRRDAVQIDHGNSLSNVIFLSSIRNVSEDTVPSSHNLRNISLQLIVPSGAVFNSGQLSGVDVYCIERIVIVSDIAGAPSAVLRVCGA